MRYRRPLARTFIDELDTKTTDNIVSCVITFGVHSVNELEAIKEEIRAVDGIHEVKDFRGQA